MCQCYIGYHMDVQLESCVRDECDNGLIENECKNGYCSEGVCECDTGYEKNTTRACSPICSLGCVNGYCSESEVCQCYSGYEFSKVDSIGGEANCTNCTNVCVPSCDDCRNGTCVEGVCSCLVGFSQDPVNDGKCVRTEDLSDSITDA